jgi:phosphoribosylaminoimidazole-succinocarboxamide synthase
MGFDLNGLLRTGIVLWIIVGSIFDIAPIKINPWTSLLKSISGIIHKSLYENIAKIEVTLADTNREIESLNKRLELIEIEAIKRRIVSFGNEVSQDMYRINKEAYDLALDDITAYDRYCKSHPDYINNKTSMNTKIILERYMELYDKGDFN